MATRGSATEGNVDLSSSPHATQNKRESRWAELAEALCLSADWLDVLEELLRDKRQLVLYGPPGTGKTYIAKRFAQAFAGDAEQVRIVQFHPAYSYEDFVEGYRPREDGGFSLVSGPLMDSAEAAREDPEHPYVLVIDELNRGNLAKVLGELYLLLEYREEAVRLLYSRNEFTLPKNLFFIGTMNTADRSIALIDAALRRRFHFLPLFPDRAPIEGLLRRWLARNKPEHLWVAEALDSANTKLMDRHFAIGPSHFLRSDLDERKIELVWRHSVVPYIEEHFFDDQNRVAEFELDRIRGEGPGSSLTSSGVADKNGKASDGTNNPAD